MSRKGTTIATDLFSAERLTNSTNGNPRYKLHTSDGVYPTQSDAACSYDVDNITRTIPRGETIPVTLHLTPAGRVWNIERPTTAADEWIVTGPDGQQLAGPFATEQEADDEAAAMMSNGESEGSATVAYVTA